MIDRLPPSAQRLPVQPPTSRTQSAASFEGWLSSQDQTPDSASTHGDGLAGSSVDTAAALLAVTLSEPTEAVFEFHVRGDVGTVEVVSVPWRLCGNDGLSYLTAEQAALTAAKLLGIQGAVGATGSMATSASNALYSNSTSAGSRQIPLNAATPLIFSPTTAAGASTRAVAEHAGTSLPASIAEPWLARLLRWFEQQGRDPVVWIRDYRLDDEASQSVTDEIRSLASQQGWQLERIVVNAREMWRAPSHEIAEETPSCP